MQLSLKVILAILIGALVVLGLELTFDGGSLLYCMLFFVAVAQGPLAVMAAADIAGGKWHRPYKREMFSTRHMMLFLAILFAVFWGAGKIDLFAWTTMDHPIPWLEENFFVARNIALLLISWLVAGQYTKASLDESPKMPMWSLFWLFAYVATQTVVAFDWVMSLKYPWISTLFGAYFFVEAFYSGLAFAAIWTFFNYQKYITENDEGAFKKSQMDMMTMMFGFSIFWAYQFYSQFIVIWYGNIPEEVAFFTERMDEFGNLLYLVLVILFVLPFLTLLFRPIKANPKAVMSVGILIWGGLLLERVIFLVPHMDLHPMITAVEFIVIGAVFYWIVRNGRPEAVST